MEGRLFGVAIWCWVYGRLIRWIDQREEWIRKRTTAMFLNALFWATFAAMVGMLVASYSERLEDTLRYSFLFGGAGIVIGLIMGYVNSENDDKRDALLADNLEWADTGFSAILLASAFMFFVVQAFKIPS